MRASTRHTALKFITAMDCRYQDERTTSVVELPPPLQAAKLYYRPSTVFNQILSGCMVIERPTTVTFVPLDADYNRIRL
jgi:hypothetical protein